MYGSTYSKTVIGVNNMFGYIGICLIAMFMIFIAVDNKYLYKGDWNDITSSYYHSNRIDGCRVWVIAQILSRNYEWMRWMNMVSPIMSGIFIASGIYGLLVLKVVRDMVGSKWGSVNGMIFLAMIRIVRWIISLGSENPTK